MDAALPIALAPHDVDVDLAFVQALRLSLRGQAFDPRAPAQLRAAHHQEVLVRALGRFERLLDDEWSPTLAHGRAVLAAAAGVPVGAVA